MFDPERGFVFRPLVGGPDGDEPVFFPLQLSAERGQEIRDELKAECIVLDELVIDEVAWLDGHDVVLPFIKAQELDASSRTQLGLPGDSELKCAVRTRGISASEDFQVLVEVEHETHGRLEGFVERCDNVYLLGPAEVLIVNKGVHDLLAAVDKGWDDTSEPMPARMVYQERVKRRAEKCGAKLEGFMAAEQYVLPEDSSIAVDFNSIDSNSVAVTPVVVTVDRDVDLQEANKLLADRERSERILSVPGIGGTRQRVILDDSDREVVDNIKAQKQIEGAEIPRMLDNPESVLPDGIDLSDFSERVIGIGITRLTVTPSISVHTREGGIFEYEGRVGVSSSSFDGGTGGAAPPQIDLDDLEELARLARETGEDYVLYKGTWVSVEPSTVENFLNSLKRAKEKYGGSRVKEDGIDGFLEIFANIGQLEYAQDSREILNRLAEAQEAERSLRFPLPDGLRCEKLLGHQEEGYLWLRALEEKGWGGLLADDMGLGKTLQTLCLLGSLKEQGKVLPSLIVVPQSLIENWRREIVKFYPDLTTRVHAGPDRPKGIRSFEQATMDCDLTITTYGIMRRDQVVMARIDWRVIVLDEAHEIKNPAAIASTACKGFKARTRLALTGTPVQNGLSELWSIMDFVQPGYLDSYDQFRKLYERPIQKGDPSAESLSEELRGKINSVCLRRLKVDELPGLPDKKEITIPVSMGDRQAAMYKSVLDQARAAGPGEVLAYIGRLVQLCSHPALVIEEDRTRSVTELEEQCPKFARTMKLVEEIRDAGERVLIFTEYRAMQELLIGALHERFGVWAARINGDVISGDRQKMVDRLNASDAFDVMVLSPTAGGVGLNITGANHVIHYTRVWNPAKEAQATDRVYRINQERNVSVYYPIVEHPDFDTVEQRMDRLLTRKKELARDIIRPGGGLGLSKSEITELLGG